MSVAGEAIKHTGISLALLFCAAVLAFAAKRLPPRKAEPPKGGPLPDMKVVEEPGQQLPEPAIKEEEPAVGARERLEKVRDLLPAAENLAKAVGTEEAQTLLLTVRKSLEEAVTTEEDKDSRKIADAIKTALSALHRLHEAAIEEGEAILQEEEPIPALPVLDPWEQLTAATISGVEIETETVKALMATIKSIQENIAKHALRMQSAREGLHKAKAFQDERDRKVLVAATCDLACIRATSKTKRRAAQGVRELHNKALSSIRALLLGKRGHVLRYAQGQLDVLRVYVELARPTRDEGAFEARVDDAKSNAAALQALEADLDAAEMIAWQTTELDNIAQSESLESMIDASNAAGDFEAALRELLARGWEAATSLTSLPERLDESSQNLLFEAAKKTQSRAINDEAKLKDTMEFLHSPLATVLLDLSDASMTSRHLVSASLVKRLMNSTNNKAQQADELIKQSARIAQTLKRRIRLETAREHIENIIANAVAVVRLREESYLQIMSCHLMTFLGKEMTLTATRAARALSHEFRPSGEQASVMPWLKGQYEAAREAAKTAKTVGETATAAASMRALTEIMVNAMYADQQAQNEG